MYYDACAGMRKAGIARRYEDAVEFETALKR
jgi:hypothetical protein